MTEKTRKEIVGEALKRNGTGIVLAIVLIALWYFQGWPIRIMLAFMLLMSIWEMYTAFAKDGSRPIRWVGVAYALLAMPVYALLGQTALLTLCALSSMVALSVLVIKGEVDLDRTVATVLPILYPGMLITLMFPILDLKPAILATTMIGVCFFPAMLNDVAAYAIGRRFGKNKLCPALSPKKTVEGAVAGGVASLLTAMLVPLVVGFFAGESIFEYFPLWQFAAMGLLTGAGAPLGDLSASMIKRHCGIKDYGSMLPGHGGMMDRMDSVVFTGAIVYCWLVFAQRII